MYVYLSSAESHHQVGDKGVLCLSWAMADHHTPAISLSQFAPDRQKKTSFIFLFCLSLGTIDGTVWALKSFHKF